MITGRIVGGLGNQLFQLFALLAYSIENKVKSIFIYEKIVTGRQTYWDSFFKNLIIFTTKFAPNNMTNEQIFGFPQFKEPGFEYTPFPNFEKDEKYSTSVFIQGYYQSYKYFEKVQDQLFSLLKLETHKTNIKNEYASYLFNADIDLVSMHFRLGDYKQKRYYHPILNYEYYEKGLTHILENREHKNRKIEVLYFCESEDNDFVFQNRIVPLKAIFPTIEFIKVDDQIDDWKQMIIMSCCNNHVIANSTFSWWGAYLCSIQNKIICYPSKWFGEYYEHNYKCDDLMPDSWINIEATSRPWDQPLI